MTIAGIHALAASAAVKAAIKDQAVYPKHC